MSKLPLTVVILAHNEESNLHDCISSVDFADDILVIENGSTDKTVEIAKSLGARVLERDLNGDYASQRNFGIENSRHDWIFMLDADERVTDDLKKSISDAVTNDENLVYKVSRENHFIEGRVLHGVLRPDRVERLFKKGSALYEGLIHERLKYTVKTKELKGRLIHFPYSTWEAHLDKMNRYTTLLAVKYHEKGKKCSFFSILFKPAWAFIKMYFIHLGFLDGKLGLQFCLLHYFYTLEKYLKLYSLNKHQGRI
ncbi:MAG: glycosyltransferase family 2 protein [Succinivibrio sp.]